MRVSTIQQFNVALNRILDLQTNTTKFQTQIATGRRINQPSDDPVASAQTLRIDQRVRNVEQYNRNADFASLRMNQQESAIAGVNDALQRVRELVIRGKTTTLSQADRRFISQEIRQRAGEVFELANSRNSSGNSFSLVLKSIPKHFRAWLPGPLSITATRRLEKCKSVSFAKSVRALAVTRYLWRFETVTVIM